jgi:hypothetical protein
MALTLKKEISASLNSGREFKPAEIPINSLAARNCFSTIKPPHITGRL